jgi:hypothetical protein
MLWQYEMSRRAYKCEQTYPSGFECLEPELPFQTFAIVPQFPASGVDQRSSLCCELLGVFAARRRYVAG